MDLKKIKNKMMKTNNILFWNVDSQVDFIEPFGKLYVKDAEKLKLNFRIISNFAKDYNIKVVSTADWHYKNSSELSNTPDFIHTFPEHCMAHTYGAAFIDETNPYLFLDKTDEEVLHFSYFKPGEFDISKTDVRNKLNLITDTRNIIITKDKFDVFDGNYLTRKIINKLKDDEIEDVYVYGVAGNVCVNYAIRGLLLNGFNVIVIEDAIKDLETIPTCVDKWLRLGVEFIKTENLNKILREK